MVPMKKEIFGVGSNNLDMAGLSGPSQVKAFFADGGTSSFGFIETSLGKRSLPPDAQAFSNVLPCGVNNNPDRTDSGRNGLRPGFIRVNRKPILPFPCFPQGFQCVVVNPPIGVLLLVHEPSQMQKVHSHRSR